MIAKEFDAVDEVDLQALVANGVAERRDLEFKRELPPKTDEGAKEFLADVSALANAQGGDLLLGVAESGGVASVVVGVATSDPDATVLAMENRITDGVQPRLIGVRIRWIDIGSGRGVVLIRVPASFAAPHRVVFKNNNRFWIRGSNRKYEMDTHELRTAFTATEQLPAKFRTLHDGALANSKGVNMPFGMTREPYALFSIAPVDLFREMRDLPLNHENSIAPVMGGGGGSAWLITLEGVILHRPVRPEGGVRSYVLTHRDGRTDAAWTIGGQTSTDSNARTVKQAWPQTFENGALDISVATESRLRPFSVEGPWVVMVTVCRVAGHRLIAGDGWMSEPAWRDQATLPQVVAEHLDETGLLPLFRSFWLLFGCERPAGRQVRT